VKQAISNYLDYEGNEKAEIEMEDVDLFIAPCLLRNRGLRMKKKFPIAFKNEKCENKRDEMIQCTDMAWNNNWFDVPLLHD
jgi:hypothetical protein